MAEKVRYFLEQSVPELEDLQNKGLFDKNEITMIMRRRTDFEHRIQSRGCKPRDFARYIDFENNLEKLREKRFKRFNSVGLVDGKKTLSDFAGVRRILFIYERAIDRYPNDLSLWNNYLVFAKKNGSVKVIYKVYTKVLQLHPAKIAFWINAANYEFEENFNIKASRVLFQRGLRFNPDSLELWLAYTEFELLYVTKLLERRRILGLLTEKQQQASEAPEVKKSMFEESSNDNNTNNGESEDVLTLPNELDDEVKEELKQLPEADLNMLGNPETNPALRGDVALTVYEVAIKTLLKHKESTTGVTSKFLKATKSDLLVTYTSQFLSVIDKFENLNRINLAGYIVNQLLQQLPEDARVKLLDITLPVRYDVINSATFADDLKLAVNKFMAYKAKKLDNVDEDAKLTNMFVEYLNDHFINSVSKEEANEKSVSILQAIIRKITK